MKPEAIASKFPKINVDQRLSILYPPPEEEASPNNLEIFAIKYAV